MITILRQFDVDQLSVRVFASEEALVRHAAGLAGEKLAQALAARGEARAVLATGNSQLKFLDALIAGRAVDWSRVTLFHMDEYLGIGRDHPASFCRYMRERVESRVHPKSFHYLAGDAAEPIAECERFEALLRAAPVDLCCLGIGENGHLAFNDPPVARFDDARWVKIVALDEANRAQQAGYGHFKGLDDVPCYGLTMTIPALLAAERVLCLAGGARKAKPVQAALHGPVSKTCPASALRTRAGAVLLLDEAAAAGAGNGE
jgi:glucosamine-6-phosphate deaminase